AEGSFDPGARKLRPSILRHGAWLPRGRPCHDGAVTRFTPRARPIRLVRPPAAPALTRRRSGLAPGLLLGSALDVLVADPREGHPVALFGAAAARAERRLWAVSRPRGIGYAMACIIPVVAAGWALQRLAGRSLPGSALMTTAG